MSKFLTWEIIARIKYKLQTGANAESNTSKVLIILLHGEPMKSLRRTLGPQR